MKAKNKNLRTLNKNNDYLIECYTGQRSVLETFF